MAKLDNSKRRQPQAVYAQVKLREKERPFRPRRLLVKASFVTTARPTREETATIRQRLQRQRTQPGVDQAVVNATLAALDAVESVAFRRGRPDVEQYGAALADVDSAALAVLGQLLLEIREERARQLIDIHDRIAKAHDTAQRAVPAVSPPTGGTIATGGTSQPPLPQPPIPGVGQASSTPPTRTGGETAPVEKPATAPLQDSGGGAEPPPPAAPPPAAVVAPALTLGALADWAVGSGWDNGELQQMLGFAQANGYSAAALKSADLPMVVEAQLAHADNVLTAFKKQIDIEPVGFLHLERMTFAPDGIERGELVYSIPLAPAEEVNITHKEWATTAEEFEKIVTDVLEEYSEEGVTEKSEIAQSTSSQQQHSNGFNTGVTASGGYGPVSITATASLSIADSATSTAEFSRNQSIAITRKASSRSKKEHKFSFKVASASGTEDQSVRKIKNPFPDKAARVDYYQLIRKWEVKVYRYGIRLTYDITIPEPGSDILSKIKAINDLEDSLQQGFGPSATLPWARFDLTPGAITRANYGQKAAEYNATVPAPPPEHRWYDVSAQHQWKTYEEAERSQFFPLEITVDDDYEIDAATVDENHTVYIDKPSHFGHQSVGDFNGKSGKRILIYQAYGLGSLYIELRVRAKLRAAGLQEWQLKAWAAIRDAAQSRYYEQRSLLKEQVAKLKEELGAQDALSLRKFEREEVMKGVLRWLFGPDFDFMPPGLPADLYAQDEAVASKKRWKEVLGHGEMIKFLHQAIEWENVLYFLYPYFWSHISRWEMKKFLDHPDPMHRAFLKSGSARVVLTIRPGFERDFVSFLETGAFAGLLPDHPYMTIIEEMEAYAKTNYPGIPPANPEEASVKEEGQMIAIWNEYTPTSALDIAFNETMPSA